MSVDRISKYFDDQVGLVSSGKIPKINSEIKSLASWLVKHQDELVPDGSKSKIVAILERYNRTAGYHAVLLGPIIQLFANFLALPEGKLCSSKDKSKVLNWYNLLNAKEDGLDSEAARGVSVARSVGGVKAVTRWSVQSLDVDKKSLTLLSEADTELWEEDLEVPSKPLFEEIRVLFESESSGEDVVVLFDETSRSVLSLVK